MNMKIGQCSQKGADNYQAKLKDSDVVIIRESDERPVLLAARFGITARSVRRIQKGDRWGHLQVIKKTKKCRNCSQELQQRKQVFCSKHCADEWYRNHLKGRFLERALQNLCTTCGGVKFDDKSLCESCRKKSCKSAALTNRKLKEETIRQYGGACSCCGETKYEFLTIDHIKGDGAAHRREVFNAERAGGPKIHRWLRANGYPKDRFRLLCYNCNCARGFFGYCPHEKEKERTA